MKKNKCTKDEKLSIFTICLIVISYGAERIIELFAPLGKTLGIIMAMVCTILVAVTIILLTKIKESSSGILASLVAYKMMPVNISFLTDYSKAADVLYYSIGKLSELVFLYFIYRFYKSQSEKNHIGAFTLVSLVAFIPVSLEISQRLSDYFFDLTGSMMGGYISRFAIYITATLLILIISFNSGYDSLRLAANFELIALSVNILKTAAKIGYRMIGNAHISRSYFVWIAVYLALMFCFTVALKFRKTDKKKQKLSD